MAWLMQLSLLVLLWMPQFALAHAEICAQFSKPLARVGSELSVRWRQKYPVYRSFTQSVDGRVRSHEFWVDTLHHKFKLQMPIWTNAQGQENLGFTNELTARTLHSLRELPRDYLKPLKLIQFHNWPNRANSDSIATAGQGLMSLFPVFLQFPFELQNFVILHEYGHLLAEFLWRTSRPSDGYIAEAIKDGPRHLTSNTAHYFGTEIYWIEDWADAVGLYLSGRRNEPAFQDAGHHRYAFLDRIF